MAKQKLPPIDGAHAEFAIRFRQALAWAEWLVYDPKTGEKLKGYYASVSGKLGFTRVYVGELYRGIKYPSGKMGQEIAKKIGVSPNWLTSGLGPMIADNLISIDHLHSEDQKVVHAMIKAMERKYPQ